MTRTETIFAIEDGVAVLTLDRPDIRNALTGEQMLDEILAALSEAERDPSVIVFVITGAGTAFSAGGDVKAMATRTGMFGGSPADISERYRSTIQRLTAALAHTDLVTIAAVNGPAIGAGFDLALGCDLRIGTPDARFAHTFARLGIVPGDGGAWLLPRVVGAQRAAELAFTSRSVGADEAVALDILLEVVGGSELMDRVSGLGREIAARPATAIRFTKRLLRNAGRMDLDEFLDLTAALQAIAHTEPDHHDAMAVYLDELARTD